MDRRRVSTLLRGLLVGAGLLLVAGAPGCAWKVYQGPRTGPSAEALLVRSRAIDTVLGDMDFSPHRGSDLAIEVTSLDPRATNGPNSPASYIRARLSERAVAAGCRPVDDPADADLLCSVMIRASGVDVTRRDFPPIYHHTTFEGLADVRWVIYELEEGRTREILRAAWAEEETLYRESYIFYIIGPVVSSHGLAETEVETDDPGADPDVAPPAAPGES